MPWEMALFSVGKERSMIIINSVVYKRTFDIEYYATSMLQRMVSRKVVWYCNHEWMFHYDII